MSKVMWQTGECESQDAQLMLLTRLFISCYQLMHLQWIY